MNVGKRASMFAKDLPILPLLQPVMDLDGTDALDFKIDRMVALVLTLGFIFVALPALWISTKVVCFVCDGLCFVLCCCSHETKIVEVSEEEWAQLKKEKKV